MLHCRDGARSGVGFLCGVGFWAGWLAGCLDGSGRWGCRCRSVDS